MSRPVPTIRITMVREGGATSASITCPADVAAACPELVLADREHFEVLLLDARNRITGRHVVSIGTLSATLVHPREVFKAAILANAAGLVCVHNHPSGDVTPSNDDLSLGKRLSEAGELMGIPNISLRPVRDCGANCSFCARDCYALKAFKAWPTVARAWERNSVAFRTGNWDQLETEIADYLEHRKPPFFRFHVAGDFLNQDHVQLAVMLAKRFPGTKFLAFTKRDDLSFARLPVNFTVVASMWPSMPDRFPKGMPRAYMQDSTETRIPRTAIPCPGQCDTCGMCWSLRSLKRSVVFHKH